MEIGSSKYIYSYNTTVSCSFWNNQEYDQFYIETEQRIMSFDIFQIFVKAPDLHNNKPLQTTLGQR